MVARHYLEPHRFICVTDEPRGLDSRIEAVPMPVRFDDLRNPSGERFPNCYCRLWNFSEDAKRVLGPRIFALDIDVVVVDDLRPLANRSEAFVGWCDDKFGWNKVAGGAYLLRTGSMTHVWTEFDAQRSPAAAFAAGNGGSDQGWMSHRIFPPPGRWSNRDGLMKLNWTAKRAAVPPTGARIVFTNGLSPPWSLEQQRQYPWIADHWKH